jgi:hypothetical protein
MSLCRAGWTTWRSYRPCAALTICVVVKLPLDPLSQTLRH